MAKTKEPNQEQQAPEQTTPEQSDMEERIRSLETIAALQERIRALESEKEAAKKTPRGTQRPLTPEELEQKAYMEERVPIRLFKDGKRYKYDEHVTVNGYTYQIQRGKTVMVPRKVALILQQSEAKDLETDEYIDGLVEKFQDNGYGYKD